MVRLLSYSLLLSFFVLLTPRETWHECDHDEHHHDVHQSSETHVEKDDCFACDFDLGIVSTPVLATFNFQKTDYPKGVARNVPGLELDAFSSFSLRGPPQV